uniref:HORMA domain-containing protein n=1 Tax=Chromera velia CCMP2878 TaxID=1169474 RepID=A0A0G4GC54_9ALVE|eukprot:Cvel_21270.t1-p1 / transcript=Cvel_21270.t1 / gene=Cvel_21270 / organism=Chromera_velia_CCMP2878 / gene_product=hypothetical protein / transcript_product=hypothetical protein / location=Cvel_scaffold1979:22899-25203(+) / protein_length=372 / sequence_SO=supercontig / SO=protein_coding / is_pseudo=false
MQRNSKAPESLENLWSLLFSLKRAALVERNTMPRVFSASSKNVLFDGARLPCLPAEPFSPEQNWVLDALISTISRERGKLSVDAFEEREMDNNSFWILRRGGEPSGFVSWMTQAQEGIAEALDKHFLKSARLSFPARDDDRTLQIYQFSFTSYEVPPGQKKLWSGQKTSERVQIPDRVMLTWAPRHEPGRNAIHCVGLKDEYRIFSGNWDTSFQRLLVDAHREVDSGVQGRVEKARLVVDGVLESADTERPLITYDQNFMVLTGLVLEKGLCLSVRELCCLFQSVMNLNVICPQAYMDLSKDDGCREAVEKLAANDVSVGSFATLGNCLFAPTKDREGFAEVVRDIVEIGREGRGGSQEEFKKSWMGGWAGL